MGPIDGAHDSRVTTLPPPARTLRAFEEQEISELDFKGSFVIIVAQQLLDIESFVSTMGVFKGVSLIVFCSSAN